jgi:soluble lytic murein transglycosylase-like protein
MINFLDLKRKELKLQTRLAQKTRAKCFMRWFDGYFTRLEVTYYNYTRGLKKKVLKTLFYYKRLAILKNGKAQIKLR